MRAGVNGTIDIGVYRRSHLLPTDMSVALALMTVVDRISRKWMDDNRLSDEQRQALWRSRKNCPNPSNAKETH